MSENGELLLSQFFEGQDTQGNDGMADSGLALPFQKYLVPVQQPHGEPGKG